MTIQSKYTVDKGLVQTGVADTEDPKFHVSGIGLSFDLETVSAGHYEITCIASTVVDAEVDANLGTLNGKSFSLDSGDGLVSFVIQNDDEAPAGDNPINVGNGARTDIQVATAVQGVIHALPGFAASRTDAKVTVQCLKTGKTAQEDLGLGNTGFTLNVLNEGSGQAGGVVSPTGVTIIDYNNGGAAVMTLGDLTKNQAGAIKLIMQTHGGTGAHVISVTNHVTSQPETYQIDAAGEKLSLIWLSNVWNEVRAKGGGNLNIAPA